MKHPAKFSNEILVLIAAFLPPQKWPRVLDPFAGTGKIHRIPNETWGVEIEPEWATMDPKTVVGNALVLPFRNSSFDAIATSPCYGNRMADHHEARDGSTRNTYRHTLGRKLHESNSGAMQWGDEYREFHRQAWGEAVRCLRQGGRFVLNIKNHIRGGKVQQVAEWHDLVLSTMLQPKDKIAVAAPGLRHGANSTLRVDHEWVYVYENTL